MPTKIKVLGFGKLGAGATAVYGPVAQGKCAYVKSMRFVNPDTSPRYIYVQVQRSGQSARYVLASATSIAASGSLESASPLCLEYNDSLLASADTANIIEFLISGLERDL